MARKLLVGSTLLALLIAAPAATAAMPTSLPIVSRTVSAADARPTTCVLLGGADLRSVGTTTYTAPISGYLTTRLAAADSSNWDLTMVDAASNRVIAGSRGFGSHEVVQSWVNAGQRLQAVGCRRSGTARSARVTFELVDIAPPKVTAAPELARVSLDRPQQAERLENMGLDVTHEVTRTHADVIALPSQLESLRTMGFHYSIRTANLEQAQGRSTAADVRAASTGAPSPLPTGRETYRSYDEIQAELEQLATDHKDIVKPISIGKSYQGRELQGLEIANNVNAGDGRPVYLVLATHHAREWASAEAAMEYANMLATRGANQDAATRDRINRLLTSERTVIVPLVNPDGYVSSRSFASVDPADALRDNGVWKGLEPAGDAVGVDTTADPTGEPNLDQCQVGCLPPSTAESIAPPGGIFTYRRKTCAGEVPNPDVPCELQYGVDPNRNYGQLWGGPGSSSDPTSQSYHGPGPWSEPETQAVHKFSQTHQVTGLITLHNVAALVLRPPGLHDGGLAPDETALKALGDRMAAATGYTSEYGFQLYDTAGTTEDWNYAAAGTFGYTIEIGPENGSFHLPYQQGFIDQWTGKYADDRAKSAPGTHGGLRDALLLAGEASADRSNHAVLSGKAPAGAVLRVRKTFPTKTSSYCPVGTDSTPIYFTGGPLYPVTAPKCPQGAQPPLTIDDFIDTTTTVPGGGKFTWDVGPSTRPFETVGKTATTVSDTPQSETRTPHKQTTAWVTDDPATALAPTDRPPTPDKNLEDQDLRVDGLGRLVLTLSFGDPTEDYDLELYKREADGSLTQVTTSANGNGQSETIDLANPADGDYVVRVVNYYGPKNDWSLKVDRYTKTTTTTPGTKENWTLTCEVGGKVVKSSEIYVARGDVKSKLNPCK